MVQTVNDKARKTEKEERVENDKQSDYTTNDKGLYGTTSAIIEQPQLIYPDKENGRMVGLEPLFPKQLIDDYNSKSN